MNELREYLPLLIPVLIIQLTLVFFALLDLRRQETTRGPRWLWVIIILFVNLIGPILYFTIGRDEA